MMKIACPHCQSLGIIPDLISQAGNWPIACHHCHQHYFAPVLSTAAPLARQLELICPHCAFDSHLDKQLYFRLIEQDFPLFCPQCHKSLDHHSLPSKPAPKPYPPLPKIIEPETFRPDEDPPEQAREEASTHATSHAGPHATSHAGPHADPHAGQTPHAPIHVGNNAGPADPPPPPPPLSEPYLTPAAAAAATPHPLDKPSEDKTIDLHVPAFSVWADEDRAPPAPPLDPPPEKSSFSLGLFIILAGFGLCGLAIIAAQKGFISRVWLDSLFAYLPQLEPHITRFLDSLTRFLP